MLLWKLAKFVFLFKNKTLKYYLKNIAILRFGALGDVIMTTPLIAAVKEKYPKSQLTYIVGNSYKGVLKNNPYIDRIIYFDEKIIFNKELNKIWALRNIIKKRRFDLIIILDKSWMWNIFAFVCDIPFRAGFDRLGEGFSNNYNIKYDGTRSEQDYYSALGLYFIGDEIHNKKPSLYPTKQDVASILKYSKRKKIIGIAPGGAANPGQVMMEKRWPKKRYIELINRLHNKVILFGGIEDIPLCNDITKSVNKKIVNLAGKLSLQQSVALMNKCYAIITNDSGAMHIASTTKTKIIVLFGPTPASRFAPKKAIVIQSNICEPCYDMYGNYKKCETKSCMKSITVDMVLGALKNGRI